MGLDSATSVYFVVELEEWLGARARTRDRRSSTRPSPSSPAIWPSGGDAGLADRLTRLAGRAAAPPRGGAAGRPRLCRAVRPRRRGGVGHLRRAGPARPRAWRGRIAAPAPPGERALLLFPSGIEFMVASLRLPLRRGHRGAADAAAAAERRATPAPASSPIARRASPCRPAALIAGERGDLTGRFGGRPWQWLAVRRAETAGDARPAGRARRHRVPAIHLGLDLGARRASWSAMPICSPIWR